MKYICESGSSTELTAYDSKFYMDSSAMLSCSPWLRMASFVAFANFLYISFFAVHLLESFIPLAAKIVMFGSLPFLQLSY